MANFTQTNLGKIHPDKLRAIPAYFEREGARITACFLPVDGTPKGVDDSVSETFVSINEAKRASRLLQRHHAAKVVRTGRDAKTRAKDFGALAGLQLARARSRTLRLEAKRALQAVGIVDGTATKNLVLLAQEADLSPSEALRTLERLAEDALRTPEEAALNHLIRRVGK